MKHGMPLALKTIRLGIATDLFLTPIGDPHMIKRIILSALVPFSITLTSCGGQQSSLDAEQTSTATVEVADDASLISLNDGKYFIEAQKDLAALSSFENGKLLTKNDTPQYTGVDRCYAGRVGWGSDTIKKGMQDSFVFVKMFDKAIRIGLSGLSGTDLSRIECEFKSGDSSKMTYKQFKELTAGYFKIIQKKETASNSNLAEVNDDVALLSLNKGKYLIEAQKDLPLLSSFENGKLLSKDDSPKYTGVDRCYVGRVGWGENTIKKGMQDSFVFVKTFGEGIRIGLAGLSGADLSRVECEFKSGDSSKMTYKQFKELTAGYFKVLQK